MLEIDDKAFGTAASFIKDLGLDEKGRVQKYIDNFVLYQSEKYMPKKSGVLIKSGRNNTKIGSGEVIWDTPYAQYLYYGKLMVDPYTLKGAFFSPDYGFWSRPNTAKILDPSGRDLNFTEGGSHWFEEMIIDKEDELIEGIEKVINNK